MNRKVNFCVKCYIFTFFCIILACTLQYTSNQSPKRQEGRENLGNTKSHISIQNRLYVCCSSALQVLWVYADKAFNFCVLSYVLFKGRRLLCWCATRAVPGYGL